MSTLDNCWRVPITINSVLHAVIIFDFMRKKPCTIISNSSTQGTIPFETSWKYHPKNMSRYKCFLWGKMLHRYFAMLLIFSNVFKSLQVKTRFWLPFVSFFFWTRLQLSVSETQEADQLPTPHTRLASFSDQCAYWTILANKSERSPV